MGYAVISFADIGMDIFSINTPLIIYFCFLLWYIINVHIYMLKYSCILRERRRGKKRMLKLTNIVKDYPTSSGAVHALRGVSIGFRAQEFVSILGPSGCGKTTLLNIIGGLDHYTDGDLAVGGRSTKQYKDRDWDVYRNHRIGFVFQSYNLIPHQTVLGNVELALTIAGVGKQERTERAKRALDRVGLEGQYYKRPNQLSGGQCQRVAIARALVNDPEILLADEPTGALDTVTSVQIMELIKEISKERLVIMVTHNPELAERYSTRIVRLLDGRIVEDTNPMTEEEEERETALRLAEEKQQSTELASVEPKERKRRRRRKEKARMSVFTAIALSAKNLVSKKKRTAMVGIAGSIGILGIALVLAFSTGINGYIASMQDDMLSGNPITIKQSGIDLDIITDMMESTETDTTKSEFGEVLINSVIKYLMSTSDFANKVMVENDLTPEYMQYVANMDRSYYSAMTFGYGIDLSPNLFTRYRTDASDEGKVVSVSRITATYTALLNQYDKYSAMASMIPSLAPSIKQMPGNIDYVSSQYELLSGSFPTSRDEILLVVDANDRLSDLLLARFGFFTQAEFSDLIWRANAEINEQPYSGNNYKGVFTYDELVGKSFYYYPTDDILRTDSSSATGIEYISDASELGDGGLELRVVGIASPADNISYGSMKSGIYYTEALTDYILESNKDSSSLQYIKENIHRFISGTTVGITYDFTYDNGDYEFSVKPENGGYLVTINGTEYSCVAADAYDGRDADAELRLVVIGDGYVRAELTTESGSAYATYRMSVSGTNVKLTFTSGTDIGLSLTLDGGKPTTASTRYLGTGGSFSLSSVDGVYAWGNGKSAAEHKGLICTFDNTAHALDVVYDRIGAGHITSLRYTYDVTADGSIVTERDENGTDILALTLTESEHYNSTGLYTATNATDTIKAMMGGIDGASSSIAGMQDSFIRMFGGNSLPCEATIYPLSFDEMYLVTDYLDLWNNGSEDIYVEGTLVDEGRWYTAKERGAVTYTNAVETIIGIIKTMIDIVSSALIAFLSISLVVSTVMIGIITYVSVVERIKEIGVIRALGGRKRDVSTLFIAETGIIGLLAGLFGILVTYLISLIVNLSLMEFLGFFGIASLSVGAAAIMVLLSVGLTLLSGVFPARSAARKDPVVALRTE